MIRTSGHVIATVHTYFALSLFPQLSFLSFLKYTYQMIANHHTFIDTDVHECSPMENIWEQTYF